MAPDTQRDSLRGVSHLRIRQENRMQSEFRDLRKLAKFLYFLCWEPIKLIYYISKACS